MREDIPLENKPKPSRFSDQNLAPKATAKTSSSSSKLKPNSWGSQIVKGFSTEKKTKPHSAIRSKKLPLTSSENTNLKNNFIPYSSRAKRSLIGEFPCSANASQVHPHVFDTHRRKSSATSHDLFLELDHLRKLLKESKERESKLVDELLEYKENTKFDALERELEEKRNETDDLILRVGLLEAEKTNLSEQLASSASVAECGNPMSDENEENGREAIKDLEMEVVELRRLNKELQLQKRNLSCMLSSAESQRATLAKATESDMLAKILAEASVLRTTNEDLCKQVEGLQMSRLTEVEELVYLRWVNSCLRQELRNSDNSPRDSSVVEMDEVLTPRSNAREFSGIDLSKSESGEFCTVTMKGLMKKNILKWQKNGEDCQISECQHLLDKDWLEAQEGRSPRRRHSISGSNGCIENLLPSTRRQSDGFICSKEMENEQFSDEKCPQATLKSDLGVVQSPRFFVNRHETNKIITSEVEKRALRVPNPPPRPSISVPSVPKKDGLASIPPPPPPPPPPQFPGRSTSVMQRAPQVVEFYHSLMKRDSRKDPSGGGIGDAPNVANVRSSMIGEIENRSSHLLAIKADVETQGEFVNSLIREVNGALYRDIEDVVAFVKWLDDELCFLVDERAVLKHFDWPEKKEDTLREAAFGYRDLKKLESEVSHYEDDPRLPCDVALKKMVALSEKMERSVYNLLRTRDVMMRHCKEFQIPTDWMLDTAIISKIKFASVKLANKYMRRVAMELQSMGASYKDPALEYMLLKGVRFAFRIHQFAGGFDAETMHAFEELRNLAYIRSKK